MSKRASLFRSKWVSARSALGLLCVCLCLFAGIARGEKPVDRRPTVAVLYFDYSGASRDLIELQKGLAQMLISDLSASPHIRIVERERLEAVLVELRLSRSAKLDPTAVNRIGRLLGARYLVVGGYFIITALLRMDARVIEVETGHVVTAQSSMGKPENILGVEQQLSRQLLHKLGEPVLEEFPKQRAAPRNPLPLPPSQISSQAVRDLSHALDAVDRGELERARAELLALLRIAPGFRPAAERLDRLIQ